MKIPTPKNRTSTKTKKNKFGQVPNINEVTTLSRFKTSVLACRPTWREFQPFATDMKIGKGLLNRPRSKRQRRRTGQRWAIDRCDRTRTGPLSASKPALKAQAVRTIQPANRASRLRRAPYRQRPSEPSVRANPATDTRK